MSDDSDAGTRRAHQTLLQDIRCDGFIECKGGQRLTKLVSLEHAAGGAEIADM